MAEYRNSGKTSGANLSSMKIVASAITVARGRMKRLGEIKSEGMVALDWSDSLVLAGFNSLLTGKI